MTKNDSTTILPPAAQYARAILSLTFGWVLLRGFQLRGDLLSPPPVDDGEMMHFGDFMAAPKVGGASRQLRGIDSTSKSSDDGGAKEHSAACLLIQKGDFHLSEWLAYHTFAAPLDYLVVAVDGPDHQSGESSETFDTYQKEIGMVIVEWKDENYYTAPDEAELADIGSREEQFKAKCGQHMRNMKREWVTYHDSDKFMAGDGTTGAAPSGDWMDRFVNHHGKEKASRLLKRAN